MPPGKVKKRWSEGSSLRTTEIASSKVKLELIFRTRFE